MKLQEKRGYMHMRMDSPIYNGILSAHSGFAASMCMSSARVQLPNAAFTTLLILHTLRALTQQLNLTLEHV